MDFQLAVLKRLFPWLICVTPLQNTKVLSLNHNIISATEEFVQVERISIF